VQQAGVLCRSGDVMGRSTAALAAERDVRVRGWRYLTGITLDRPRAGGAAQWRSATIVADEKEGLSGVVRIRTWLAHEFSSYFDAALRGRRCMGER